jgi:hypothetical protein
MIEQKKKRRLRSVILVSAVGAVACGGQAADSGPNNSEMTTGDGDMPVVGDPVGEPIGDPACVGTGGCYYIGVPGTGGALIGLPPLVGTGGAFVGQPPGTGGGPIGVPPELGGMGGTTEMPGEPVIGIPR